MPVDLRVSAVEYLAWRRAMGYRLHRHDGLIGQFLYYLGEQHESRISVEHALAWACLPGDTRARWHTARLAAIRGFAAHVHAHHAEAAELIPAGLVPSRVEHAVPYLYTAAQLAGLITHARILRPQVRGLTLATVIGLMATTGMRIGEALALDTTSLEHAGATIAVTGKYGKQRLLPVHSSTTTALSSYLRTSRALVGSPPDQALFVTGNATRPLAGNIEHGFRALTRACRLPAGTGNNEPRLHDLRHTFAVNTQVRGIAADASFDEIGKRLLPATSSIIIDHELVGERRVTPPDQARNLAGAMNDSMLHQIRLHRVLDCCIRCNGTDRLPRHFRSSARGRACGADRLAIDRPEAFARLEHCWLPVWSTPTAPGSTSMPGSRRWRRIWGT